MAKTFNDPLFTSQWYLLNTGQRGGTSRLDINVMSAWDRYSGKGVIVAVNDDGMDLTHPSLVANLLTDLTYDTVRGTTGKGFEGTDNSHGTVVGSVRSQHLSSPRQQSIRISGTRSLIFKCALLNRLIKDDRQGYAPYILYLIRNIVFKGSSKDRLKNLQARVHHL